MKPDKRLYPVTDIQTFICNLLTHPNCTETYRKLYDIPLALSIKPGVDFRRVNRAFHSLQLRHDVFRLTFVPTKKGWHARISDTPRADINIIDYGAEQAHNQTEHVASLLKQHVDITQDPLISFDLLRYGDKGDVLLFRIHHLVSDGYGWIVAVENFLSLILNIPIIGKPISYPNYIKTFQTLSSNQLKLGWDYWENLLFPAIPTPNLGRKAKGLDPYVPAFTDRNTSTYQNELTADQSNQILNRAKDFGVTTYALLSGAFYGACHDISGATELTFSTTLGRNEAMLDNFAGCHVQALILACRKENGTSVKGQSRAIHQQVRESMKHLPHPATIPLGPLQQKIHENGGLLNQFMLSIARSEGRQNRSIFSKALSPSAGKQSVGMYVIDNIRIPDNARTTRELSIVQSRNAENLSLTFNYDTEGFNTSEISDFASCYTKLLIHGD
jgi:hypothetical protein